MFGLSSVSLRYLAYETCRWPAGATCGRSIYPMQVEIGGEDLRTS